MPTALITGATEGIGRAICFTLGKAGYKIAACARTPSRLRALKDGLEEAGISVAVHPADVGIEADVKTFEQSITQVATASEANWNDVKDHVKQCKKEAEKSLNAADRKID